MDIAKILVELRKERDQVDEVILSLERLARNRGLGLPPAGTAAIVAPRRGRPVGSKNRRSTKSNGITAVA